MVWSPGQRLWRVDRQEQRDRGPLPALLRRELTSGLRMRTTELRKDLPAQLPGRAKPAAKLQSGLHGELVAERVARPTRAMQRHLGQPSCPDGQHHRGQHSGCGSGCDRRRGPAGLTYATAGPIVSTICNAPIVFLDYLSILKYSI